MKYRVMLVNPTTGVQRELFFRVTNSEELRLITQGFEDLGLIILELERV